MSGHVRWGSWRSVSASLSLHEASITVDQCYCVSSECISNGETVEEAIQNGLDALHETIVALESMNLPVPEPGGNGAYSGKFIQRVPKSLHARLALRAKQEGVSMNLLVNTLLAESLGRRELA